VGFLLVKVALGPVLSEYLGFPWSILFPIPGVLGCDTVLTDVWKDHTAFIFRVKQFGPEDE
jgi:hypothetical protein